MQHATQQTSLFAYRNEIKPTLGDRQRVVYEALRTRKNFTNTELATWLSFPINTVTPRVNELRKMGLVRLSETRKCAQTSRMCCAWEIGVMENKLL